MLNFDTSLDIAINCVLSIYPEVDWTCTRFIRDMYGCIFVVLPDEYAENEAKITMLNASLVEKLSSYASSVTPATFFQKYWQATSF